MGVIAPSPTSEAGRFGVDARVRHWMEFYELSARAAVMKTCFIGCADASNTRTRRVLRTMAAPIFNSFRLGADRSGAGLRKLGAL